jgi:hypothetical protein
LRSLVTGIPACESRSATAIGNSGGTTACSTPSALQALTTTPRSTSSRGIPSAIRSSKPNSSDACACGPPGIAAIRSTSNDVETVCREPLRSTYRNGSGTTIGTSCRIAGEWTVSA